MRPRRTESSREFVALSELLGGDVDRTVRVLRAFHQTVSDELDLLDKALRASDGRLAGEAAHRAAMACHLVGKKRAGRLLAAFVHAGHDKSIDPVLTQLIVRARATLVEIIEETSAFIASDVSGNGGCDPGAFQGGERHGS